MSRPIFEMFDQKEDLRGDNMSCGLKKKYYFPALIGSKYENNNVIKFVFEVVAYKILN